MSDRRLLTITASPTRVIGWQRSINGTRHFTSYKCIPQPVLKQCLFRYFFYPTHFKTSQFITYINHSIQLNYLQILLNKLSLNIIFSQRQYPLRWLESLHIKNKSNYSKRCTYHCSFKRKLTKFKVNCGKSLHKYRFR